MAVRKRPNKMDAIEMATPRPHRVEARCERLLYGNLLKPAR